MISKEEVKKLAQLARIELTEEEVAHFAKDMGEILAYVETVKEVAKEKTEKSEGLVKNVLRKDQVSEASELFADAVLENVPHASGRFVVVKKIIEDK